MSNRIQYLTFLGTLQTKKGDWILNKRTTIPHCAGILLSRRYTLETHKENGFFSKTFHYIIQWDNVSCEIRKGYETMTSCAEYIQGYFAFENKQDAKELLSYFNK
jgi:hypothetical protein